ncbi:MAG: SDR family NAD(P)-dependent oxidoreductase [Candidatus Firestonebacteria bacterium]
MRLKDKTVLITGAASGIGRAIALNFAAEGANVCIADINIEKAEEVAQQIVAPGLKSFAVKADVSKKTEVNGMVKEFIRRFERIDVLINNAGISVIAPFLETQEEVWDNVLNINLKGTFLCSQAVIPYMLKQKQGKIVNVSSQSGKKGSIWYSAYCASKFGVIGLTQSMALEFASEGININALCPGVVFTPLWDKQLAQYGKKYGLSSEKAKDYLISKIPLGRFPKLEEIANVALFLSAGDSDYMTGQSIEVTGGA